MSNDFYLIAGWRPIAAHRADTLSKTKFDKMVKGATVEPFVKLNEGKEYHIHGIQPITNNPGSYWMMIEGDVNSLVFSANGEIEESTEDCLGSADYLESGIVVGKYKVLFFAKREAVLVDQGRLVCKLPFKLWISKSVYGIMLYRHPFIIKHMMYVIGEGQQLFRCNMQAITDQLSRHEADKSMQLGMTFKDHIVLIDKDVKDCCVDLKTGTMYYLNEAGIVMSGNKRFVCMERNRTTSKDRCYVAIAAIGMSIVVASIKDLDNKKAEINFELFNCKGRLTHELSTTTESEFEFVTYLKAFELRRCKMLVSARLIGYCDLYAIHCSKLHVIKSRLQISVATNCSIWDLLVEVDKNKADIIFVGFEIFNRISISIK